MDGSCQKHLHQLSLTYQDMKKRYKNLVLFYFVLEVNDSCQKNKVLRTVTKFVLDVNVFICTFKSRLPSAGCSTKR